jgi:cysteine desulfurase
MQSSMQQPTLESRPEAQALKPGTVKLPIYLDNQATTPVDPRVLDAMLPYFSEKFGNAASRSHSFGWEAERAVERAREQIARLIGASPKEIVFTSGATESDNLAIKGIVEAAAEQAENGSAGHIVTQATEHKAVLDCCHRLEARGVRVTILPVKAEGVIDLRELRESIDDGTTLVTVMLANNEIGTIQPVAEIGALCRERGIPFHTDAVQAAGKVAIDVETMNIDALSLSAHKIYGPKGVGALYIRRHPRLPVAAQIDGGGHERGYRSGTLNVPGIVGMGEACEIALHEMEAESRRIAALRDRLKQKLEAGLTEVHVNGTMEHRLPGNLNMTFCGVDGEALLMALDDIALSSGSACTSAAIEPSYVLRALGRSEDEAQSSIRFGLGRFNTEAEIDYVAQRTIEAVRSLRELSLD